MSQHVRSNMETEITEATIKRLRYAAVSSNEKSIRPFEDFLSAIVASEVTLEDGLTEAMQLFVQRHPTQ